MSPWAIEMNLAEALGSSDAILFVGSGASMWSGLPSWGKLLDELADYLEHHGIDSALVRMESKQGDLLQAASYAFDKLTRPQQGEFVRRVCRYGIARPSALHRLLITLGPRCFITTNYDNLIEEALRLWRADQFFRPPITNRNLIGMPEIVQARAVDFVFKPHGDAADPESIVLTREQYRMLMPGGERQATLESLSMLLVTRPVVFIGFGLRDPDFLYLKDVLLNIYKGGTRDHFALMADVSPEQVDYWRRTYGIHLIRYETTPKSDGTRDHGALLTVLENARETWSRSNRANDIGPGGAELDPELALTLMRYASGLARVRKLATELTIRVGTKRSSDATNRGRPNLFAGATVESLLDRFEKKIILVGLPGAGKSHALRKSAARQADKLQSACLSDADAADLVIPIFADLKLYEGSLERLVGASLPVGLDFQYLLKRFNVRIYLDSFNEVPRRFVESGEYSIDLERFIQAVGPASLVIGSRTLDGLDELGFDVYELEAIDESAVEDELHKRDISLGGRFQFEMTQLLQRPFFFRYLIDGELALPGEPHPREFYRLLIEEMQRSVQVKLGEAIDLTKILRPVAYEALNSGREAFPLAVLLKAIAANVPGSVSRTANASEIANGLVSCSLLVSYSGERVAFVHQSITEYLASLELAARFAVAPELLLEKLGMRRWDQSLFLTLSHLPSPLDRQFFNRLLDIDLELAVASAKFVETGREQLIGELLGELIRRSDSIDPHNSRLSFAMERGFPVSESHLPQLWQLVRSKNALRGAAAYCIVELCAGTAKAELLRMLFEFPDDFNFCANTVGPLLASYAVEDDLATLAQWSCELEGGIEDEYEESEFQGFVNGAAAFVEHLPMKSVQRFFAPSSFQDMATSPIRSEIYREIVRDRRTTESLQCAVDLLLMGDREAPVLIYFILRFARPEDNLDTGIFNASHLNVLLRMYREESAKADRWTWDAIDQVCLHRADLRLAVEAAAEKSHGLSRAGLMMCVHQGQAPAFEALEALLSMPDHELPEANCWLIARWELNWSGRDGLFLSLLRRKSAELCDGLLGSRLPPDLNGLAQVEILNPQWWLDWISECLDAREHWRADLLSSFLGSYAAASLARDFVSELNDPSSRYRALLLCHVLYRFGSVTTDDFTDETADFAIADLLQRNGSDNDSLLAQAATESFIVEKLLPLLSRVGRNEAARVRAVLNEAGRRHGRRYF